MQAIYTAAEWEVSEAPPSDVGTIHPGEHLIADFLKPLGITQSRMADDLGVPFRRVHEIANGKRAITAETAILFAKYLGTTPQFWLGLQTRYDLDCLRGKMAEKLARVRAQPPADASGRRVVSPRQAIAESQTSRERSEPGPGTRL